MSGGRAAREATFCFAAFLVMLACLWAIGDGRFWTGLVGLGLFWGCLWAAGEPGVEGEDE